MNYKLNEELKKNYDKYFMSNICNIFDEIQLPVDQYEIDCEKFMKGWNKQVFKKKLTSSLELLSFTYAIL